MRRARDLWIVIFLIPLAFLGIFYLYPLLSILDVSLRPDGALDLSGFVRLLSSDYYIGTLLFTVYQAALSTVLTLAAGHALRIRLRALSLPRQDAAAFAGDAAFCLADRGSRAGFRDLLGKNGC